MKKGNDWKQRLNVVYSTNPDFQYDTEETEEPEELPKNQQPLRVLIDRHARKGKVVTVVKGFIGPEDSLKALGKWLKTQCGVGGSAKDGQLILQGEMKEKVTNLLKKEGYTQTK